MPVELHALKELEVNLNQIALLIDSADGSIGLGCVIPDSIRARGTRLEAAIKLNPEALKGVCTPTEILNETFKVRCCGLQFTFASTCPEDQISGLEAYAKGRAKITSFLPGSLHDAHCVLDNHIK